jgi:hypothetical protein
LGVYINIYFWDDLLIKFVKNVEFILLNYVGIIYAQMYVLSKVPKLISTVIILTLSNLMKNDGTHNVKLLY